MNKYLSILSRLDQFCILRRNFVSAEFLCKDAWDQRLSAPIFKKIELESFFFEVERKFIRERRGSAIDVDIFANAAVSPNELEQLDELLHKFRRTPQTCTMLPSTSHAVVRTFLEDLKRTKHEPDSIGKNSLLRILDDRLNYGIFMDSYSAILLLDFFLEQHNWRDASKVAIQHMIQEEFNIPIAREMDIYALYQYALKQTPQPWDLGLDSNSQAAEIPEDEVKIRVKYLSSDYYDDHFDIRDSNHLVGKSLVKFVEAGLKSGFTCQSDQATNTNISDNSLLVLGLCLWGKWDKLSIVLDKTISLKLPLASACLQRCFDFEKFKEMFNQKEISEDFNIDIEALLLSEIKQSISNHEKSYITQQIKAYSSWNENREAEIEKQHNLYLFENRKRALLAKKAEIAAEEEVLFFFDNLEATDLMKAEKEIVWRRTFPSRSWSKMRTCEPKEVGGTKSSEIKKTSRKHSN